MAGCGRRPSRDAASWRRDRSVDRSGRRFGQVAGDVLLADGPLGGGDGGLDVAERGVDPLEGGWPHRRAAAGADRLMCASHIGDTAEASEAENPLPLKRPGDRGRARSHSRWPSLPSEDKREIVETITDHITVGKDDISIELCYLPPTTPSSTSP